MAFKMNRPGKMNGPRKSTINKYGRAKNVPTDGSGIYYNSKMGPMKMVNPSALKQMEEEMERVVLPHLILVKDKVLLVDLE